MSVIGTIFGAAAAEPIKAAGDALNKLFTSDDERLSRQEILARIQQEQNLQQIEVNKAEATNQNLFVSGARPAAIWCCLLILINSYIIAPYIEIFTGVSMPAVPLDFINSVFFGLLGLAGFRTYEKTKGVSR